MVARRNLNVDGDEWFNDIVASLAESAAQSKTRAAGTIGLSADGDITWEWPGADGLPVEKSVKRFQVELDDTSERADALAADLEASAVRLADAEAALADLRDVALPEMRFDLETAGQEAQEGLRDALDRIATAETTIRDARADLDALADTLSGADLEALQASLAASQSAITHLQDDVMPTLDMRIVEAQEAVQALAETDVGDLQDRLGVAERAVKALEDEGLPALAGQIAAAEASQAATADALARTAADVDAAQAGLADTAARLDAANARIDASALQATNGPTPPAGAPIGAQWISPGGFLYVRVPCEGVAG